MPAQRRLALGVLLGAAGLAIAAFPLRATWWGGWILAIAEAGIVGGLADWFAVTAIFRRPLGLPIPHTGLIPRNWERMAERVGVMVGGRVLTKDYVREEIGRVDLAELLARGAERISRGDLERATRIVAGWAAAELTEATAAELLSRARRALTRQPVAPLLAAALRVARRQGWDQRMIDGGLAVLAESMERPEFREAVGEVIDDLLQRYRERLGVYPRMWMGLAALLGVLDRERLVAALHAGLREVAKDRDHPLRTQGVEVLADLERRLTADAALAARVEAAKAELLEAPAVATLLDEAATALTRTLRAELADERSELLAWLADRLDRARQALIADAALRGELDAWAKARLSELVERHHTRIAGFIENGVRALGPEGAVRLIEEHAGDDLQFIRVNGTVVGGLAGGLIYAVHLIVDALL
ncbi:MAG TPA: DUF445 domain-containing protein [Candidatus Acidoferrum sp.]|jgi:uncharacterized membrane-anchored protein YjiN (DUF445 family)|nr:DUF445 domain-containing protein [Candidatus Acidoferrum sp.]